MDNGVPIHKIIRHIASGNTEYAGEVHDWLNESAGNEKIYQDLLNLWQVTGSFPDRFSPDKLIAWENIRAKIRPQKKKRVLYRWLYRAAAAIVVISFSVWTGTRLDRWGPGTSCTEVISPEGQKTKVILPDSSVVLLNGGTSIRYDRNFGLHDRTVELHGEGYFDVRKDPAKKFIVKTPEINIRVFGTSFNVKDYDDDQSVEVGLKRGSIGIEQGEKEIAHLVPGQVAIFEKGEKKLHIQKMDMNLVSAWTRNELVFEENSMQEIVKYIERWYGVNIQISPKLLDNERFTFRVKTESLRELLSLINFLKPIDYKIEGKTVIINQPQK